MKRTHLPLNGLRVLDAAARHLSFTRAADELAVTPAAVGQQIRALEDTLGVVLFRRTTKGLELTAEGEAGLPALRDGFLHFEEAVRAMQAQQSSKVLTIAAPRDVIARWLMPRLAAYAASDAELRFHLVDADDEIDFTQVNVDLGILWRAACDGLESAAIDDGGFVQVGKGAAIGWPGDPQTDAAVQVMSAGAAIEAAARGLGSAWVPALLVPDAPSVADRRDGAGARYWLAAPLPQWRQKKVKALVAALLG